MPEVCYVILTCDAYLPTRGAAVRETWLRGAEGWFLSATPNPEQRVLGWNTRDDYASCPSKYYEFFRTTRLESDWIVLVDDDTFVYRDRLETYLASLSPDERLYIGYSFSTTPRDICMSGGAGIVLSRALYTAICDLVRSGASPPMDPTFSDLTLCVWIRSIDYVRAIIDPRFHWKAAMSLDEQRTAFTFHYACPAHMRSYLRGESMDISILIPTMTSRKGLFETVRAEIQRQAAECPQIRTEILWESDNGELTLGQKRNVLVDRCTGRYHCFIDDDDVLAPDYLKTFVPMITSGIDYDCASFVGAHYDRGTLNKLFHHSLAYSEWSETTDRFLRTVSPMNLIKTDIVRQVRYKDIRNTEDHEFSKRLMASGLLTTEFAINPNRPIYHYIDGVKADRDQWTYSWKGDYLSLVKPFRVTPFHLGHIQSSGNVPYPFLKLSRG